METIEKAKIWCRGEARENPPKKGKKYYFENDNSLSYAKEIEHDVFKPLGYGARRVFYKFDKVLIDGVYENKYGLFVGYWYTNGTYRTCKITEIKDINSDIVSKIGLACTY